MELQKVTVWEVPQTGKWRAMATFQGETIRVSGATEAEVVARMQATLIRAGCLLGPLRSKEEIEVPDIGLDIDKAV